MSFSKGIGRWVGSAEVYGGDGRFLGNGMDTRSVQDLGEGRVRIDVAFIGPMKAAGHYFIQAKGDHRIYQGPINVGYAETLDNGVVDANAYWAALGLSQQFFLMVLDDVQLSLALMSRGSQLIYAVVGENNKVIDDTPNPLPKIVNGTSYDLANDATAGRNNLLMHRAGTWAGELKILDADRKPQGTTIYTETIDANLQVDITGNAFVKHHHAFQLMTNDWQAWTPSGKVVGSYSLYGGRALSGDFHYLDDELRVWKREVINGEGTQKAVVHTWYQGGKTDWYSVWCARIYCGD